MKRPSRLATILPRAPTSAPATVVATVVAAVTVATGDTASSGGGLDVLPW